MSVVGNSLGSSRIGAPDPFSLDVGNSLGSSRIGAPDPFSLDVFDPFSLPTSAGKTTAVAKSIFDPFSLDAWVPVSGPTPPGRTSPVAQNIFDPFSLDAWDPVSGPTPPGKTSPVANNIFDPFSLDAWDPVSGPTPPGKTSPVAKNIFDPFSLDAWDPISGPTSPGKTSPVAKNICDPFSPPTSAGKTTVVANAWIVWKKTPEGHVFKVDIPGLKKEEMKVEVEDGTILQISGERIKDQEEWHGVGRSSCKFLWRFTLPENVNLDQVKAAMENRVLTVTVPLEEVKKPEVRVVDISG